MIECGYVRYEREDRQGLEASVNQGARVSIYHLLCAAFGQGVAITKVVDLNVLDVVTVLLVDLDIESTTIGGSGGRLCRVRLDAGRVGLSAVSIVVSLDFFFGVFESYCTNGRDVDMLRGLLLAKLRVNACCCLGRCSCRVPLGCSSLDAVSDGAATTDGALTVVLRRGARAAVKLASSQRLRLGLVEAGTFAWFVTHLCQ
jgi:hypothetical protein